MKTRIQFVICLVVLAWLLPLDGGACTTFCLKEKNGNLLWQHQGTTSPLLTLVEFSGDCAIDYPPNELPYITLNGDVRFLGIRLKHFLFHD